MNARITVLLVEDHPVVLRGLRAICAEQEDLEVVGEVATSADALGAALNLEPDAVMLPIKLGGTRSGIELCRAIKSVSSARVVVFTSFTRTVDVQLAMLAGADALISKAAAVEDFVAALRQVASGRHGLVLGPGARTPTTAQRFSQTEPLTDREDEILQLVLDGLTNPEISSRLKIEVSTVKTHMRNILRKLSVGTRRGLFVEPD
ncbi:response regulator [Streptomyces sp. NPDC017964]|uniref:response regulator n=1 Tax=Streptomyces sp. NPDC017964 TaxID=3365022 RepID=UPI0037B9522A